MNAILAGERIPDTLGAFDSIVQRARKQNEENRCAEAELQASLDWTKDELERLLRKGGPKAFAFFAKRRNQVQAPEVSRLLWESAIEDDHIGERLMDLVFYASEGMQVQAMAMELRGMLVEAAAKSEVGV